MKISEVKISLVKPNNGLFGFASFVIDEKIYLSSVAIHKKLNGDGYRLTYPTKHANNHIFHPITKEASTAIETAVFEELKNVMRKFKNDRHNYNIYE